VQLVLDDERRGRQRCAAVNRRPHSARICGAIEAPLVLAVDMAEEGARLAEPRKAGEFVDGGNDEGWQTTVNHLIDGQDWERPRSGEGAGRIGAANFHIPRRSHPQTKRIGDAFRRFPSSPLCSKRFGGSRSWKRASRRRFGGSPEMASQANQRGKIVALMPVVFRFVPGGTNRAPGAALGNSLPEH
jgi:hypothetical protein